MLNDYIKNNKSDEQLAHEFASLLNKGQSMWKVSKLYDFRAEKVREIMDKHGYELNPYYQKWIQNEKKMQQESKETDTIQDIDNGNKIDSYTENKVIGIDELKPNISVPKIVDLINDGIDIAAVGKQYNISYKEVLNILHVNGYKNYQFINKWSKQTERELIDSLVNELNTGITLYDLSGKYVKNNKDRIKFVSVLEQTLKENDYEYISKEHQWLKKEKIVNIQLIVIELNKGIPMKTVAEQFKTSAANIRLALKKEDYRYDPLFKVWTKKRRKDLVNSLAEELRAGLISLVELKEKGINTEVLEIELRNSGQFPIEEDNFDQKTEPLSNTVENENTEMNTKVDTIHNSNSYFSIDQKSKEEIFNKEEIEHLKEIIKYWEKKKGERTNTNAATTELTIYLEKEIVNKLTLASEKEGISRSLIIKKALENYLLK